MPTNPFISLFGRSPIGPMQQHIAKAHECAAGLLPFFRAVIAEDWAQVEQVQQDMVRLEQEADRLKKNVRMHLPKSLFLPVPRSDLLELLSVQDKVANRAKDIAGLMLGRRMRIPLPLQGQMLAYVQRSVDASAQALRVVNELNELLETGFGGRETSLVESMVEELEAIENDTDRIQVEVRRELFRLESELPPVDVMFLYQIIEWIGDVADRAHGSATAWSNCWRVERQVSFRLLPAYGSPPMSLIADHGFAFLVLACLFGFFMAWGVGANDVANAMGTSVGSRALTIRQAILVAMVFEFCGAYFAGGEVTETIRSGIVDPQYMTPDLLVFGMLSALLAAGVWLLLATIKGWPVSTTHSIVGAIIGFASVGVSVHAVHWGAIGPIVASWVVTPVLSGLLAFTLFRSVQWLVLHAEDPFRSARRYVPLYMFLAGFMVALMTVGKGLKHVGLELSGIQTLGLALLAGGLVMGLGIVLLLRIRPTGGADPRGGFASVERVFAVLMIFTACSMAFAHGANDVANAIGPVAAVVAVVQAGGDLELVTRSPVPSWVLLLGAVGIVIGLATYGYRVIATIGREITELTPSRGFAAELATASTVVGASAIGLPVSTTHTLVGAVLGIGMARGIGALNLRVIGSIFLSWVVTLPAGAVLAILFFLVLRALFGA